MAPILRLDPLLIDSIRFAHRRREDYLRPAMALNNQIKAIERRFAKESEQGTTSQVDALSFVITQDLEEHRQALEEKAAQSAKQLEKLAKQLPVWPWVESVRGAGAMTLGQVVAECGDLSLYDGPAKVWKRMGVGIVDGERQRRVAGNPELAKRMGYSPKRRAMVYNIACSLVKGNKGNYYAYYREVKAAATERGWDKQKSKPPYPGASGTNRAEQHALRLLGKRYLRDLWREWNRIPELQTTN
jgi:hypothetical protein